MNQFEQGVQTEEKKRAENKDRSGSKYSQDDFLQLPREEQFELAKRYLCGKSSDFDDGTFQFSLTTFKGLCERLGFENKLVDTRIEEKTKTTILEVDFSEKRETVQKKLTISKETDELFNELVGDMPNAQKSRVTDAILYFALTELLRKRELGAFSVVERPREARKII